MSTAKPARNWKQPERPARADMVMEGWPFRECPGCGSRVQPGERVTYAPEGYPGPPTGNGDVWPWHTRCMSPVCPHCGDTHDRPYDGGCLL